MEKFLLMSAGWVGLMLACAMSGGSDEVALPPPLKKSGVSVEEAIARRRTVRDFTSASITLEQLATLCWAGQGITSREGGFPRRSAPSAGALYPIFLYVAIGDKAISEIPAGVYKYLPLEHKLKLIVKGDQRRPIAVASLEQMWMRHPALNFIITVDYSRITPKYGRRGIQYAHFEAGHIAQNIMLEAIALNLASGIVGAFSDEEVKKAVGLPPGEEPLLILPVGHPAK